MSADATALPSYTRRHHSLLRYMVSIVAVHALWIVIFIAGQVMQGLLLSHGDGLSPVTIPWMLILLPMYYAICFAFLAPGTAVVAAVVWIARAHVNRRLAAASIASVVWFLFALLFLRDDRRTLIDLIHMTVSGGAFGALMPLPPPRTDRGTAPAPMHGAA